MIQGVSHITFIVEDLEKSSRLLRQVFDAQEIYFSGEKTHSLSKERFFLIGGQWIVLMEGTSLRERSYQHVAFKIEEKTYDMYLKRIQDLGLEIRPQRPRISGEGRSIYFYDYDNHLFELHTGTLEERLRAYGQGAHESYFNNVFLISQISDKRSRSPLIY